MKISEFIEKLMLLKNDWGDIEVNFMEYTKEDKETLCHWKEIINTAYDGTILFEFKDIKSYYVDIVHPSINK